jgi:hypothetical protein
MSAKKGFLIVLVVITLALIIGAGGAKAGISKSTTLSASTQPYLGKELVISALDNEQVLPAVAYNPLHNEYLVVWHNKWGGGRDIYAQRLNGMGELLSWFSIESYVPSPSYNNDRFQPSVAYDSTHDRYLVVWAYDLNGDGSNMDIHGIFVDWDGPIQGLHEFVICDWPTQQWVPKVAYSPVEDEFMIVWWTDHPSVPDYISGRRMKASDGSFPNTGSDFTISDPSDIRVNPEIAYNLWRNQYLVVYDDTQDIFSTRFNAKGAALDGGEFAIAGWPGQEILPSVAYDWINDQYLVAWQNPQPDIYARFVSGDGYLDPIVLHLEFTSVGEIKPKVAYPSSGGKFLVTWQQQFSSASGPYGVWGQFVNTDKTLGTYFGIMSPTAGITAEFTSPVVAGGDSNFLTVWEHDRAGTIFQDIHGRLIFPYVQFLPLALGN